MIENNQQPKEYDVVLGGENPPDVSAAVLGGIAGVKKRLESSIIQQRITAIQEAINYGKEGLELVIQALQDEKVEMRIAALKSLQNSRKAEAQQILKKYLDLASEVDMVYFRLQELLALGEWDAADKQTRSIVLRICKREDLWLRKEDIKILPCTDLNTIDRLWIYHSQGRFGFSVQKQIWQNCINKTQGQIGTQTYQMFCDFVGWRIEEDTGRWGTKNYLIHRREDIPCDLNAPIGHFPSICTFGGGKRELEPYTTDTESTMGFYSIDGYHSVWTTDSFFGPAMVQYFLNHLHKCKI